MSYLSEKLKEVETRVSTVLGVAEGAVVTPAKELATFVRELVAELEAAEPKVEEVVDTAEADAESEGLAAKTASKS